MAFFKSALEEAREFYEKTKKQTKGYVARRVPFSTAQKEAYKPVVERVKEVTSKFNVSDVYEQVKTRVVEPVSQALYQTQQPKYALAENFATATKDRVVRPALQEFQRTTQPKYSLAGNLSTTTRDILQKQYSLGRIKKSFEVGIPAISAFKQIVYDPKTKTPFPTFQRTYQDITEGGREIATKGWKDADPEIKRRYIDATLGMIAQISATPIEVSVTKGVLPESTARNVLKIKKGATPEQIRKSYIDLSKKYHPDAPKGDPKAFKLVKEAYDTLTKAVKPPVPTQLQAGEVKLDPTKGVGKDLIEKGYPQKAVKQLTSKQGVQLQSLIKPETPTLDPHRGLGSDLARRGYSAEEITTKTPIEAHKILATGKTPDPAWIKEGRKAPALSRDVDMPAKEMDAITREIPVKEKVHALNYLSTPELVLKKIGLEKEAVAIRKGWEKYNTDLKTEIQKVTNWMEKVPEKESAGNIFRWLDGKPQELTKQELKVAEEIKIYLRQWANKLGLPKDKRISNYITHIFERGKIEKEFDPELAKELEGKIPGSVYDPFLLARKGQEGYIEDAWRALSAYVKRATRKYAMDPSLKGLKEAGKKVDLESYKYIQKYASQINVRPTEIDTLIDNFIKSTPIKYELGQRPIIMTGKAFRQVIYRATLGLNVRSAFTNLSQGANTYAELGEKYTIIGYSKLFKKIATKDLQELYNNHVLDDGFIRDKDLNVKKTLMNKIDPVLFYLFDSVEKINRGSAYYGAKAKAIGEGKTELEAIDLAKETVRKTQFKFSAIDTPVALQAETVKLLTQFQSYGIKQIEFLAGKVQKREWAGLIRYLVASFIFWKYIGKPLYGMTVEQLIPTFGESPAVQLGKSTLKMLSLDEEKRATGKKELLRSVPGLTIPAGTQFKKTLGGIEFLKKGYSITPSGKVRYPAPDTTAEKIGAVVFGQWSTKEARKYFKEDAHPTSVDTNIKRRMAQAIMTDDKKAQEKLLPELKKYDISPKDVAKEAYVRVMLIKNEKKSRQALKDILPLLKKSGLSIKDAKTALRQKQYTPTVKEKLVKDYAKAKTDEEKKKILKEIKASGMKLETFRKHLLLYQK